MGYEFNHHVGTNKSWSVAAVDLAFMSLHVLWEDTSCNLVPLGALCKTPLMLIT